MVVLSATCGGDGASNGIDGGVYTNKLGGAAGKDKEAILLWSLGVSIDGGYSGFVPPGSDCVVD